jgi:Undecaprenyl-phosphate glucose phosphotransferase
VLSAIESVLEQPAPRAVVHLQPAILLDLVRATDAAIIILAGGMAAWSQAVNPALVPFALALGTLLALNLLQLASAYRLPALKQPGLQARLAILAIGAALLLVAGIDLVLGQGLVPPELVGLWLAAALPLLLLSRAALPALIRRLERSGLLALRVVVVGAGEQGQRLVHQLRAAREGVRLVGLFDDRGTCAPCYVGGNPVLGGIDRLLAFAARQPVDLVIVALSQGAEARLQETLRRLRQLPVDIRLCPDQIGTRLGGGRVTELAGVPLLHVHDRPLAGRARLAKAALDRALAAFVLLLTAPLFLGIAVAIRLGSAGPVLFRQKRYGCNGQVIEIFKFRTMWAEACDDGTGPFRQVRKGDLRVTPLGRFLRRTSLDELPQFLNVLRGEMSIVGPRPHAVAHARQFAPLLDTYLAQHRVKPGITGWAQVHGLRGETDTLEKMRQRLEHDLHYIDNWSLSLDLRIILRTLLVGFSHPNAC